MYGSLERNPSTPNQRKLGWTWTQLYLKKSNEWKEKENRWGLLLPNGKARGRSNVMGPFPCGICDRRLQAHSLCSTTGSVHMVKDDTLTWRNERRLRLYKSTSFHSCRRTSMDGRLWSTQTQNHLPMHVSTLIAYSTEREASHLAEEGLTTTSLCVTGKFMHISLASLCIINSLYSVASISVYEFLRWSQNKVMKPEQKIVQMGGKRKRQKFR